MKLVDFDYDLPDGLIATRPMVPRSAARLLVAEGDRICDTRVGDLVDLFRAGDRLILNNTKVIPARLTGFRQRGPDAAKIEITLLEPVAQGWRALAKPLRKLTTIGPLRPRRTRAGSSQCCTTSRTRTSETSCSSSASMTSSGMSRL